MNDSLLPPISAEDKQKVKENLAKPLDSLPTKNSHRKGKSLITIVLLILIAAGIAAPAYLITQKNLQVAKEEEKKSILVETSNQEIKDLLEKEFVYTGSGETNYHSPNLDSSFTVNVSLLRISESTRSVYLYPMQEGIFTGGKSFAEVSTNTKNPYELSKELYGTSEKFVRTAEETKDGYITFTVTYQSTSLFGDKKKESVNKTYYYKKIAGEDIYAYLTSTTYDGDVISADIAAEFVKVITSFEYKPESASPTASVLIPDISAAVSYDRKTWELTSQYSSYANFTLHQIDYKEPYVAVNFRGGKIYAEDGEELNYAKKIAEEEVTYAKENKTNFKLTKENETLKLGTLDLLHSAYTYKTTTENVYTDIYYGISQDKKSYYEVVSYIYVDIGQKHDATYKSAEIQTLIKGFSFTAQKDSNVLGENTLNVEEPALVGKLGTVHIANTTCATFTITDPVNLPKISGTSKEYCSAGLGTGFFVTPEGHIITNAHVASGDPFTGSVELFLGAQGEIFQEVFKEIARQILAVDPNAIQTDEDVRQLAILTQKYILTLIGEEKIKATKVEYTNYMELDTPFDWDFDTKKLKNPNAYAKLDLVKANTLESPLKHVGKLIADDKDPNAEPYQYTVADLALLKVSQPTGTYPAIALGDEATLLEGSTILAIGFPGVADDSQLFSESSSTTATITRGAISAVKNNPTNTYKLVQTDAAINHGNSGGPIINDSSKVIAVSTYLVSGGQESDNYGAGISVGEVKNFLDTASVTPKESEIAKVILEGINNMQKSYYKVALTNFDSAVQKYPKSADLVKPLKLIAQEKITAGEDNSPLYTLGTWNIHPSDMPVVLAGLGGALLALILLLIVVLKKKPKKVPPVVAFDQPLGTMPVEKQTQPSMGVSATKPLDPQPGAMPPTPTIAEPESAPAPMPVPVTPVPQAVKEPTIAAMEQAPKTFMPQPVTMPPQPVVQTMVSEPILSTQSQPMPVQPPTTVAPSLSENGLPLLHPEPTRVKPPEVSPVAPPVQSNMPSVQTTNPIPPVTPVMP